MLPHSTAGPLSIIKSVTVPLSSRHHFNHINEGLRGIAGAQKVISLLSSRRTGAVKISLNHNLLGDDGTGRLFAYLSSADGSKHRAAVTEIVLTNNNIGCKGLQAIAEFICGNDVLEILWLTNNALTPDLVSLTCFANALNSSRLRLLSLTGNSQLGDLFVERFFPLLRSRALVELHINTIGLTPRGAPAIAAWLTGSKMMENQGECYLHILKCSGNNLGVSGAWQIVRAIEKGNWVLSKVEMYANQLTDPQLQHTAGQSSSTEYPMRDQPPPETEEAWKDCGRSLHRVIMRNHYWRRQTQKEACNLLRYARPLLLCSKSFSTSSASSTRGPNANPPPPSTILFPFFALPNELKLHILSLFAPSLSSAQRIRVFKYASNPKTLPPLTLSFRETGKGLFSSLETTHGLSSPDEKYMTSGVGLTRREQERAKFLEVVGCYSYEPEPRGHVD